MSGIIYNSRITPSQGIRRVRDSVGGVVLLWVIERTWYKLGKLRK